MCVCVCLRVCVCMCVCVHVCVRDNESVCVCLFVFTNVMWIFSDFVMVIEVAIWPLYVFVCEHTPFACTDK